jgi:hypothetical protein
MNNYSLNPHPPGTEWHQQWESSTGAEWRTNPWFDKPKPKPRRKVTDLVAVRFVGITALAAVIGLPIWWTGWHLLDRYLGWIWT